MSHDLDAVSEPWFRGCGARLKWGFACLQVSWEGGSDSADDLSPWKVYAADVDEDSLKNMLLGSSPAVTAACARLGRNCHSITAQVRPLTILA